eukprot:403368978
MSQHSQEDHELMNTPLSSICYPIFSQQQQNQPQYNQYLKLGQMPFDTQSQLNLDKLSQITGGSTRTSNQTPTINQIAQKKRDDGFKYIPQVTFEYHEHMTVEHLISNSIQGFLIWLLKVKGPMYDEQIMPFYKDEQKFIKRPNGQDITSEPRRIIRSVLGTNAKVFSKDNFGKYKLNGEEAVQKYLSELIVKYMRLRSETEEQEGKQLPQSTDEFQVPPHIKERAEILFDEEFQKNTCQEDYINQVIANMSGDEDTRPPSNSEIQLNNPEDYSYFSTSTTNQAQKSGGVKGPNGKKLNTNYHYDKAINLFNFMDDMVNKMPNSSIQKTHQDPLLFVKDLKDKDLLELLNSKDERFKGMMEFYAIFRDIIAHERMSDLHDKYSKMNKMASQLEEMCKNVNYVDEALKFLSTHSYKDNSFVKTPFIDPSQNQQMMFGSSQKVPGGGHVLSSGIKIFNNSNMPTSSEMRNGGGGTNSNNQNGKKPIMGLGPTAPNKFKVAHPQQQLQQYR